MLIGESRAGEEALPLCTFPDLLGWWAYLAVIGGGLFQPEIFFTSVATAVTMPKHSAANDGAVELRSPGPAGRRARR